MNVKPRHVSDSLEQREAEIVMLERLNKEQGYSLAGDSVPVGNGAAVKVDGIDRGRRVLCEVYSRIGRLKGAQPHKIASDMLKLALAERELGGTWLKLICFADSEAAKCVLGKSWLAIAARRMGFEVVVVELPSAIKERLLSAQRRQVMVNPSGAGEAETFSREARLGLLPFIYISAFALWRRVGVSFGALWKVRRTLRWSWRSWRGWLRF